MVKMIMHGCGGAMGRTIAGLVEKTEGIELVAGIDLHASGQETFPVFASLSECDVPADVVVDFSSAKAVDTLMDVCAEKKLPLVLCTTGLSEEQIAHVSETAKQTAVLRSANMSLGINTLMKLLKDAAKVLAGAGFDQKLDAPSGTALALADSINDAMNDVYHYKYDRSKERAKRDPKEIGISVVRGGSIVGEHDVIFAGTDEVVTFSHTAYSKAIFAKGAIEAAIFLATQKPGLYTMADVIEASSN